MSDIEERRDADPAAADTPMSRRRAFGVFGSLGAAALFGCGGGGADASTGTATGGSSSAGASASAGSTSSAGSSAASSASASAASSAAGSSAASVACTLVPQETEGPYPLLAILSNSAITRRDITEGKTGVPLTLTLKLVSTAQNCAPIVGAAVYIWHCDKDGVYSGYTSQTGGVSTVGQMFLRGVQVTDASGAVSFTTLYPGWYAGRITHIHFQVYLNDNLRVTATATSQLAFPQDITRAVYASSLYAARGQNTSVTSFAADNVFSDGTTYQMLEVSGDVTDGYAAALTVGIAG
ncbi:MAG: intradiol ring-cleavage dioxygenase [Rhodocyclaceae bacterium]